MPLSLSTRRPGIVFQTVPTPRPGALPRMDVAGLVGFAARGPLNVPVPVEDDARFAEVFGPPLDLVRDPDTGEMETSHLAAAVASFFRTGGRRCWVVRVAEAPAQRWFVVPGLVDARSGRPAVARARSLGSGFDDLRVGTVLRRRTVPNTTLHRNGDRWLLHWTVRPDGIEPGTLLRVTMPDGEARPDVELFMAVDDIRETSAHSSAGAPPTGGAGITATTAYVTAYRVNQDLSTSPPGGAPAIVRQVDGAAALPQGADGAVSPAAGPATLTTTPRGLHVRFDDVVAPVPEVGRVRIADLEDGRTAWLRVDVARTMDDPVAPSGRSTHVQVREHRWPVDPGTVVADGARVSGGLVVERLTFDLLAWRGEDVEGRLTDLHLTARAPRSWLRLPTDDALFDLVDGAAVWPARGSLADEVFDPRFPLAGPTDAPDAIDPAPVFIPFVMATQPDPASARGPVPDARPALVRDGLRTFSNALFLDGDLAGVTTASLRQRAPEKLLLREDATMRGLHTLWPVREVTLLALPDTVHRGWREAAGSTLPVAFPAPEELTAVPCTNDLTLLCIDWTPVAAPIVAPGASSPQPVRYELQESPSPAFEPPTQRYEGPDVHTERPVTEDCPRRLFFRVRAIAGAARSPWSAPAVAGMPGADFRPQREELGASTLRLDTAPSPVDVVLRWERVPQDPFDGAPAGSSPAEASVVVYDLERARDPVFATAETVSDVRVAGLQTLEHVPDRGSERAFYRARARLAATDHPGPWSNTVVLAPEADLSMIPVAPRRYDRPSPGDPNRGRDGLLDVQRAVLRFCAARGDVLAMLALPAHDQQAEARDHITRLTRLDMPVDASAIGPLGILPFRADEGRTLSFGALYHPWTTVASTGPARTTTHPPDGTACGAAAARALQRGAWSAPANVPLNGVIALRPLLRAGVADTLLDAQVNVLSLGPRGVVALTAQTLVPDEALQPIATRRLLILLRRLAERVGMGLVFEPNRPALRRRGAAVFDRVLADLYRRGALAGAHAREAYRIKADAPVNPPARAEHGQLVVEVHVAPARPLEFLVVRLVQLGPQTFTVDER